MVEWKKNGADAAEAEFELYDYQTDPLETKNLASEQPRPMAELRALLATHPEAKPQFKVTSPKEAAKAKAPAKDRMAMFLKRDLDGDGRLSREEFLRNQPDPEEAPKRFPVFDANGDGYLSAEEFVKSGKVK